MFILCQIIHACTSRIQICFFLQGLLQKTAFWPPPFFPSKATTFNSSADVLWIYLRISKEHAHISAWFFSYRYYQLTPFYERLALFHHLLAPSTYIHNSLPVHAFSQYTCIIILVTVFSVCIMTGKHSLQLNHDYFYFPSHHVFLPWS